MSQPIDGPPSQSRWSRPGVIALIAAGVLIALCAVVVVLQRPQVTQARQQTTRQALLSPSGARLHLGHYGDITRWEAPLATDYAVQDGMVIFPESNTAAAHDRLGIPPIVFPVMVYAPDGGDLSARPGPPADRYIASNEWFLIKCRAVAYSPNWWECGLLFGDAAQQ